MKYIIFVILTAALFSSCSDKRGPAIVHYPLSAVPVRNVELTDSFWLPKVRLIQQTTIKYAFGKCSQEGRMDNFLIAGGKMKGTTRGKMPFDDTDLYKIIEGASLSLISHPDPVLEAYIDSIIDIIKVGQEPDGYITTWFTIDRAHPPAPWVKPSKERWENEISSHELYNSGHLFEAATAHYDATGKRNFLDIALKNADLLVANFGPDKKHTVPGHQIVETRLIKLYRISEDRKYLDLAKFFLDQRGDSTTRALYGAYNQDHISVIRQDEVVGHAVRGVYMYAAMTDIAAMYNDTLYRNVVDRLWKNMVNKKLYITGGIGARHEGESFGDDYELPNLTAYGETCAAIGSVYWNHRLFLLNADVGYYDIIERTLFNGLLSGISTDGTKFFYPNPLESDGRYPFNMGACTRQGWFDCSCCPTNLIRFVPSIPGLIYSTVADTVYINLYMANKASIPLGSKTIIINQVTNYPWDGKIKIVIDAEKKMNFSLKLRIPYWARNQAVPGNLYTYIGQADDAYKLTLNGQQIKSNYATGYVTITNEWSPGDVLEISLPMSVKRVKASDQVAVDSGKVALEFGPFVYCAEEIDNGSLIDNPVVSDSTSFEVERKIDPAGEINMLTAETNSGKLTLIPYFLWSNRGVGKMKVWFAEP